MGTSRNHYAFIDAQNLHLGMKASGWRIDYRRFRLYLKNKYGVCKAHLFIGYIDKNKGLYEYFRNCGFDLVFKEVSHGRDGMPKRNVDVDLTLHTMIEFPKYDKAIIITSDGDFSSLVRYLASQEKFEHVLSPVKRHTSGLLKRAAGNRIRYLEAIKSKIDRR